MDTSQPRSSSCQTRFENSIKRYTIASLTALLFLFGFLNSRLIFSFFFVRQAVGNEKDGGGVVDIDLICFCFNTRRLRSIATYLPWTFGRKVLFTSLL